MRLPLRRRNCRDFRRYAEKTQKMIEIGKNLCYNRINFCGGYPVIIRRRYQ